SIRAGLPASTITPGSTPPLESLTRPMMALWAEAKAGSNVNARPASRAVFPERVRSMSPPRLEQEIWGVCVTVYHLRQTGGINIWSQVARKCASPRLAAYRFPLFKGTVRFTPTVEY